MSKLVKLQCTTCGGTLEKLDNERYRCDSCGLVYERAADRYEGVCGEEINRASFERWQGRFEEALNCYDRVLECDPNNFEANWGSWLSEHNIGYVTASDGTQTPVFYGIKQERIFDNHYYIKAMQSCPAGEEGNFASVAEKLENTRINALREEGKAACDVLIACRKFDENGEKSEDFFQAEKLYNLLKKQNLSVFCPATDLADEHPSFTEPKIYAAIKKAKVLIAVASREEYALSDEMKSIWRRFPRINLQGKILLVSKEENVFPGEILRKAAGKYSFGEDKELLSHINGSLGEREKTQVKQKAPSEDKPEEKPFVASKKQPEKRSEPERRATSDRDFSQSGTKASYSDVTSYVPLKYNSKDSIATNPDALDRVADAVRRYNNGQMNVINACLTEIRYLTGQWDDRNMEQVLREIGAIASKFEQQIPQAELFSRWLEEKANILRKNF